MRFEIVGAMVARRIPEKAFAEQWEAAELQRDVQRVLNLDLPVADWAREEGIDETHVRERVEAAAESFMAAKAANLGPELMRFVEKSLLLQTLDQVWKEHLLALDHLRQGIGLRAYGQRDPLNEYKAEAFALFNAMLDDLRERVTQALSRVELSAEPPPMPQSLPQGMVENFAAPAFAGGDTLPEGNMQRLAPAAIALAPFDPEDPTSWSGVSRNAPCPCGSGKKYKHCHGRAA
jgi:preprotein translocase subunit SecA